MQSNHDYTARKYAVNPIRNRRQQQQQHLKSASENVRTQRIGEL